VFKLWQIYLTPISLVMLSGCGAGDYSKPLGNGYTLERTNACCIFVAKKNTKSGFGMTRTIKPLVTELYVDETKIVGVKSKNQCCYLTEDEKADITPNGYFIIYKKDGLILSGLSQEELKDRNISIKKMEEIL